MAKKQIIDSIVKLYSKLGGNISEVLGTRSNVNFMGTGKSSEPFLDMDLNIEALGAISKSKALDELKSSVGFATADKLNDIQANKLLNNMMKMDEFYNPPAAPANITDLGTGTRNLDAEGLGSLRAGSRQMNADELADFEMQMGDRLEAYDFDGTIKDAQRILADDKAYTDEMLAQYKAGKLDPAPGEGNREKFLRGKFEEMEASGDKRLMTRDEIEELSAFDDLPPPVEQGFKGFERTIRELAKSDPELAAQYKTVLTNKGGTPSKRATAREFLVEALKKDEYDVGTASFGKTNLNNIISAEDVKYITEGGGGIGGDPLVLVEKYFGPRIREMIPEGASSEEIVIFTKRVLENVVDAAGNKPGDPKFDRMTARILEIKTPGGPKQPFATGGRVGFQDGGHSRFEVGSGYYGETPTTTSNNPPSNNGDGGGGNEPPIKINTVVESKDIPIIDRSIPTAVGLEALLKDKGKFKAVFDAEEAIKDSDLGSGAVFSYDGSIGPVDVNAMTNLSGDKSLNIGYQTAGGTNLGLKTDLDDNAMFTLSRTFADGGRAGFWGGGLGRAGKAGYQAIRKYGIEAEDITNLFKSLATDKSLVGQEKTEYFKMLNQVLKNPDDYPDGVREILMRLGKPVDFAHGGLAKILEV